jgi:DNA repair protein RecN (Recombination protein N)
LRAGARRAAKALDAAMAGRACAAEDGARGLHDHLRRGRTRARGDRRRHLRGRHQPRRARRPLNRIASGGELSRFLLALKVCLSRSGNGRTLIFDEIDRGVGGATADAVGRRLRALAGGGQVLVVTHSPQVAARGAHHWRVEKAGGAGETFSRVMQLSAEARVDEIARMLAGDTVTEAARAAARALIAPGTAA